MNNSKKMPSVALGTWSWGVGAVGGNEVFGNHLEETELKPVFETAMEHGLNLWDTAVVYGMSASERILGAFAKMYPREQLLLSTKFTPQIAGNGADPVAEMCQGSLERLGTDYIDIYWIHNPADVERWTPFLAPLVQSGKVKQVGVSNHNLEQIKRAEDILSKEGVHIAAVQNHYSLLYRSSEQGGILDYCKEHGITFFSYMVLEQGALSGKYTTQNPMPDGSQRAETYNPILPQLENLTGVMRGIGAKYGVDVPQIAIAWAIAKGTTPIIGVTKPSHVEAAAQAATLKLTAEEMGMLEQLAAEAGVDTRGAWENPMA
ncbi:2%2C5-diketo-D-gluconate reductase B [uncultured Flavonifractor sp.]|nr:2%2C5-diketo-D-gluconate reductase B [uncultured Flavonifractor sp.]